MIDCQQYIEVVSDNPVFYIDIIDTCTPEPPIIDSYPYSYPLTYGT